MKKRKKEIMQMIADAEVIDLHRVDLYREQIKSAYALLRCRADHAVDAAQWALLAEIIERPLRERIEAALEWRPDYEDN